MSIIDLIINYTIDPFLEYDFMRRALSAGLILALGGSPLGVFMMLRRLSLVGDALSHAILPGVAVAFLISGLSVWAMTIGGVIAAIIVALLSFILVHKTKIKEDSAFTLLYLVSLAFGVALISMKGSSVNLFHMLFGNILAINSDTLYLITAVSCISLFSIAFLYRRLVIDGFDHAFLHVAGSSRRLAGFTSAFFFIMLMINLVSAFQAMGTLMALGLMLLPAIAARFWAKTLDGLLPISLLIAFFSVYSGLLVSYHFSVPSGPSIVMVAGAIAFISSLIGNIGSMRCFAHI